MDRVFKPTLQPFLDSTISVDEAHYVFFGAPLDATASQRSGSRFAPDAVRKASQYMENYSLRTRLDLSDVSLADAGNLRISNSLETSLELISEALASIRGYSKISAMIGGEHTVTLGALRALKPSLVLDFDAHMDLRDSLLGARLSHGTFMRRAMEELGFKLVILGCRAFSKGELEFAKENLGRLVLVTADDLIRGGTQAALEKFESWLGDASSTYLSIDMDVLDPAQAPAVGNPSPEGIGVTHLLDLVSACVDERILGFDLTEVTPHYDSGLTAIQAAHVTFETLCVVQAASGRRL